MSTCFSGAMLSTSTTPETSDTGGSPPRLRVACSRRTTPLVPLIALPPPSAQHSPGRLEVGTAGTLARASARRPPDLLRRPRPLLRRLRQRPRQERLRLAEARGHVGPVARVRALRGGELLDQRRVVRRDARVRRGRLGAGHPVERREIAQAEPGER